MTPDFDFSKLRAEGGDRREGFEEFSAQIFNRLTVPPGSRYERYRGVGGDGGVEAIWRFPSGKVIGLQSKFFLPLKAAHLAQLEKSLDTALDNYPELATYIVTLPFDPTPTVKARPGAGEAEKLEAWRKTLIANAADRGVTLAVEWWHASELKSRLLGMDNADGRILYWFGTAHLSSASLKAAATVAEGVAGARYSPRLRVGTEADATLKAFGQDPGWPAVSEGWGARLREALRTWNDRSPSAHPDAAGQILDALTEAAIRFAAVKDLRFTEADRAALEVLATAALPVARTLESALKEAFDSTHGAENDTPSWRQQQAAYQVRFPAADLDHARAACALFADMVAFADSPAARAAGADVLLMRGPAGIGKTHTTMDATKERLASGRGAMTILGQEISQGQNLWSVVASKLGIGPTVTTSQILGILAAYAEGSGSPFVIMVDAINETPERKQWRAWLPQLKADLTGQPIKLLLTCRDIFVEDALGAGTGIVSFTHAGFAGREYDAAYAFAAFYKVGPPAEVVAQPEFANPLFLHLVCRAAVTMKWARIPGGQVSLTSLITAILDGANVQAAELLDHDVRIENPVREGALALADAMGKQGVRAVPLREADVLLRTVRPAQGASKSLLRAMEEADLISVSPDIHMPVLRFAFERLGDVLIAQASIAGQDRATVETRFLSGDLSSLFASADTVVANAGLIQAYSIILPELFGVEVADLLQASPVNREVTMLALGVLVWRDLTSFGNTNWAMRHGRFIDLMEVFGHVLAVAAVPGHPLNADWLDMLLRAFAQLERDALWTATLKQAWDEEGPARQLVRIARAQNLTHMSRESAILLGTALAWFTASANLLIRDEASQALTRLMLAQPVATTLIDDFARSDDDFIRERVLTSAYGAGLLRKEPAYWGEIADRTFDTFFAASGAPENVVLRDLGRLIVEEGIAAGTMATPPAAAAVRPPHSSPWPLRLKFANWPALEAAHPELPGNLNLGRKWQPDFARYCVEPRARLFDLAAAGLTLATLNQWIVEQILGLGYDGSSKISLGYDWALVNEHGQERGVANRHRRVSKKYEWIFLARLLGRLHDHVPLRAPTWGAPLAPTALQAVELRTLDPTDLSEGKDTVFGVRLTHFFEQPSITPLDPKEWTASLFTSRDIKLVAEDWVMLAGSQSWRHESETSGLYRHKSHRVHAMLVPNAKMPALKKSFTEAFPNSDIPVHRDVFQGEFPGAVAMADHLNRRSDDDDAYGVPASAIITRFDDPETPVHDLWVPAPELIASAMAVWDGARSWHDSSGAPVAAQIGQGDLVALVFSKARLVEHMTATKSRLVWIEFGTRQASMASRPLGSNDLHRVWSWNGGKSVTKVVEELEDFSHQDEVEDEDEDVYESDDLDIVFGDEADPTAGDDDHKNGA